MFSIDARSTNVLCGRSGELRSFTRGGSKGCDAWEREPGIDDDDWDPAGIPRIAPYVPEALPLPRSRSSGTDGWWTEPPQPRRPAVTHKVELILVPVRDPFGGSST